MVQVKSGNMVECECGCIFVSLWFDLKCPSCGKLVKVTDREMYDGVQLRDSILQAIEDVKNNDNN